MSVAGENVQRCPARRTSNDKPCGRQVIPATGYCIAHSPESNEWRRRGGAGTSHHRRAMKLLPARLLPIFNRLLNVFEALDAGEYDRQQATAMATVATALLRIVMAGELEERVRLLEGQMRQADGEGWRA